MQGSAPACRTCVSKKQQILMHFACFEFAVRLDELHADICSCMLGMRNKKRFRMRDARLEFVVR